MALLHHYPADAVFGNGDALLLLSDDDDQMSGPGWIELKNRKACLKD